MKKSIFILALFVISLNIWTCSIKPDQEDMFPAIGEIKVSYELVSNNIAESPRFLAKFILENASKFELGNSEWTMYYSQVTRLPIQETVPDIVTIEHINGDFFRMAPTEKFNLKPGETIEIPFESQDWLIKKSDAPSGIYFVYTDPDGNEVSTIPVDNLNILPFSKPDQINRHLGDETPIPTPDWQYEQNNKLDLLPVDKLKHIIPAPVSISSKEETVTLKDNLMIHHEADLKNEAVLLANHLSARMGKKPMVMESSVSGPNIVVLRTGPVKVRDVDQEAYTLEIDSEKGVVITGSDPAGVFYGTQSLVALLPVKSFSSPQSALELKAVKISDAPAFGYRGMHFDVGRNFQTKETVLKFLDAMAFYKLNTFHFHLTDDEGWRLEIEELPELTDVGAYRGHTLDESEYLAPAYGSGPFPDPSVSHGSGFYTRDDFKEILKYANERHIEVIPEVNMPGHARAAIIAMEFRYRRLMKEGKKEEAEKYRLIDPDDQSEYSSAQLYDDNIICVCKEPAYTFYETVIDNIIEIYKEAGLSLKTMHTGGDEVPFGAWEKSPLCNALLEENPEITNYRNLQPYFFSRLVDILKKRNLTIAGWEEVAMTFLPDGGWEANTEFAGKNVIPYVWNSIWGNQDLGYRLANGGYPVVLCNVNNFYFDLAYNKDPDENGAYWGGFINTKSAFNFVPYDLYRSIEHNVMGHAFDPDRDFKDLERLNADNHKNILGLQGEIWSETVKGQDKLEYYCFPKLIGLAERAWEGTPAWGKIDDKTKRDVMMNQAWNIFANTIAQRELPRLDYLFGGFKYRLAPPGAIIINGKLEANSSFPGMMIRYTTDGSDPTTESPAYEGPVEVNGTIKLMTFSSSGRGSRTVEIR